MKRFLLAIVILFLCTDVWAAKLTEQTAATAVTTDDVLYVVDSPGGTPVSKKITVADFSLGSHTAKADLNMGTFDVLNAGGLTVVGVSSQWTFGNGYFVNGDNANNFELGSTGFETICYDVESTANTNVISDCESTGLSKIQFKQISLDLKGATYSNVIQSSGSQTQTNTFTLPVDDGTSGQTLLTDGNGVLSWGTGGAAPAGSASEVQYRASAAALGAIVNTSTDGTTLSMTSPKVVTGINDTNGNELIKVTATGSAINEITLANAATGNNPTVTVSSSADTNVGLNLAMRGTGALNISSTSTATNTFTGGIVVTGHIETNGTAPTLTSCGTSPSIIGNDQGFTVTAGTTTNGCTATFATAWTNTPHCAVVNQSGGTFTYTVSTTAIVMTKTTMDGNKVDVVCMGDN